MMRRLAILLVACCVFIPSAYASDAETGNDVCQALRDGPDPAGETLNVERLPRGFVCHDVNTSSWPSLGSLAWIGRTDAGTRFWADTSSDLTRIRSAVSLEQLRGIELEFQSLLKPVAGDPGETVIRVYSADGERFEERKIRFSCWDEFGMSIPCAGTPPRDFVLDMRRSAERVEEYVGTDGLVLHPVTFSDLSNPKCYAPIEAYAPIEVVLDLRPYCIE